MHTDPAISTFVIAILVILGFSMLMHKLRQPTVLVYLLVGLILGPSFLGTITDQDLLTRLGAFGVILLLFFVGMEVSPRKLVDNWLISVIGTLLQVLVSVLVVAAIGWYLEWSLSRIILLGFVISLSSTAVVIRLLEDQREVNTRVGQNVIGILLVQDLIIVPMLILLDFLGGRKPSTEILILQLLGGAGIIALTAWIIIKEEIRLPWIKKLGTDHETQVFASLGICFGMALLTGMLHLSAALGAFIGGMIVASAKETTWVHNSLLPIRTIFIALFFVSVGMLIDVDFIIENFLKISLLILAAYLTNTLINASILKALGEEWNVSIYGASLLSQIGEFSFLIAAIGLNNKIINLDGYRLTISVISLTLLLSPIWIGMIKYITNMANTKLKKIS